MTPAVQQSPRQTVKLQVNRRFRLPLLPGVPCVPRTFTSTYYDTEDYRLSHAGIMLCYQVEQRKGTWQLTFPCASGVAVLTYAGSAATPPAQVAELLFVHLHDQALHPITKLRTRQSGVHVRDIEGPLAEVSVRTVTALNGRRVTRTFTELEIMPTENHEHALQRLEQTLRDAGATDGDHRPLGLQVLGLELPQPLPEVPPEAPLAEHLKRMLQAQVCALLLADPGTRLGADPEDLHQMRVATRRLRAYLRAMRPVLVGEWAEVLRSELAWLGGSLGPVRDLDVLLERFHAESALLPVPEQRAFARLLPVLERQRKDNRTAMLAALRSERYVQLLTRLEVAAKTPEVAATIVSLVDMAAAAFKRLRKAMREVGPETSDAELHRVRIYGKRARYAAELAEAVVGKPASRFLQQAKVWQDLLGEHQDAIVAETHLRYLLLQTHGRLVAFTLGRLVERLQASRRNVRTTLPKAWAKFARQGQKTWAQVTDSP
jgi:CHAD domain-containing protein